jgi:hypothetical protein
VDRWRWFSGAAEIDAVEKYLCSATLQDLLLHSEEYARAYDVLADAESRALFVQLVAYRLLGHRHVRLPPNRPEVWAVRARVEALPSRPTEFRGLFGPLRAYEIDFEGERICGSTSTIAPA